MLKFTNFDEKHKLLSGQVTCRKNDNITIQRNSLKTHPKHVKTGLKTLLKRARDASVLPTGKYKIKQQFLMGNCEDKGESCSVSQVPEEIKLFLYGWRKTKDLRVDLPLPANGRSAGLKCQVPLGHLWPQSLNIITQKRVDNLHYQSSIIVSSRKQGELPETSQQSWSETPQHFRRIWGSMTTKAWLTPEIKKDMMLRWWLR